MNYTVSTRFDECIQSIAYEQKKQELEMAFISLGSKLQPLSRNAFSIINNRRWIKCVFIAKELRTSADERSANQNDLVASHGPLSLRYLPFELLIVQ